MFAFALLVSFVSVASAATSDVLFTKYPFVMSHDAASGELNQKRDFVLDDWTRTQSNGLVSQLNCGARAFDYRPYKQDDTIYAAHGGVVIHKPMSESLSEVIEWSSANPEDLVLFYLSHFSGDSDCEQAVLSLLASFNITTLSTSSDCASLSSMTYEQVKQRSSLSTGGYVVALFDCVDEQFDSAINCFGRKDGKKFDCTNPDTKQIPFDDLSSYAQKVTSSQHSGLFMNQAHWQSSTESVIMGTVRFSSVIKQETDSSVNQWVAGQIQTGQWTYLNLVELDEVCDAGQEVYDALKNFYLPSITRK